MAKATFNLRVDGVVEVSLVLWVLEREGILRCSPDEHLDIRDSAPFSPTQNEPTIPEMRIGRYDAYVSEVSVVILLKLSARRIRSPRPDHSRAVVGGKFNTIAIFWA